MTQPAAIVTPPRITAFAPIHAPSSTTTGRCTGVPARAPEGPNSWPPPAKVTVVLTATFRPITTGPSKRQRWLTNEPSPISTSVLRNRDPEKIRARPTRAPQARSEPAAAASGGCIEERPAEVDHLAATAAAATPVTRPAITPP